MALLAADEPLLLNGKRATQVITRRIKQGLAEWYVLEVLEKSRDGLCEHTRQGWNIGRPPYGYLAERVPHPVPAKRSQGATKSRLRLDPVRAPVVAQIFAWRVTEQLGYRTIASRLNADPGRYPPPIPNRPQAAKGLWCASTVTDILHNPKYTGYMVWNRVAESTSGRRNPPEAWVWSPTPTHPAIVARELLEQAAAVGRHHVGSRDGAGANLAHPDTRRSYLLRSMVVCAHCDRRMRGRTIQQRRYTYYTCRPAEAHGPRARQLWPDHPKSIAVREDYLLDGILDFFAKTVFHPERHQRLADHLATADVHSLRAAERQRAALQRTIADLDARARRLVRALELNTALDGDSGGGAAFAEVRERLAELQRQREATARDLAALDDQQQPADTGAVELLDALPVGTVTLQGVPEPTLRRLFVAFQLQVRYDKHANWATLQVTLQEDRLDELLAVAGAITDPQQPPAHGDGTDDGPPFAHAVPVPGGTGNAWASPQAAETPRRLVLGGGFVVDGGRDRRLGERARVLGFGGLREYLQARCDSGSSIPRIASELWISDWEVQAALSRLGVRLASRPQRLAQQRRRYTEERIADRVAALGFADVGVYLADRVVQRGWLLAEVAAELAAHRVTVRRLLDRHGIRRVRRTTAERAASKAGLRVQSVSWQARRAARLAELGFGDLGAYLRARHIVQGWSVKRMRAELRVSRRWLVGELARLGLRP